MDNYRELIETADYAKDCEFGLACMWIHPELLPKKLLTLGRYDNGFYKMPERYTNYTFLSGAPLKEPVIVPVVSFRKDLFASNEDITDLILSRNMGSIPEGAFKDMKNLRRIWIPKGISYILKDTFIGCENLEEVYYEGSEEDFGKIDIYYKQFTVISKPGLIDEVRVWYDSGNLPLINAKKYYNVVREPIDKAVEATVEVGGRTVNEIFK